ncbi:asparagine--tRNA ligase [mine drainage metagenome]|uniref:Asparagine--tRNA ligase n=1 Tax=mine drainage metagenome TaxID=410659 RepID=A0A1J5PQ00_9ZZZZ
MLQFESYFLTLLLWVLGNDLRKRYLNDLKAQLSGKCVQIMRGITMTITHAGTNDGINTQAVDEDRFLRILDDPITGLLVDLQDLVTRRTTEFWSERGARNMHLPITTNSISSPMGLGSDSQPVQIDLFGQTTYLADSMQFMLEYGCRLSDKGAWYLMPSFRGEDADDRHLNQFFHSEAEIIGNLTDVMDTAESYVRHLTSAVLEEHRDRLLSITGRADHLEAMMSSDPFPRITLDEAERLLGGDPRSIQRHPEGFRVLTSHGERRLMDEVSPFLWVTHFDHLSVPFYQGYGDADLQSSLNGDLLFGIGEVVGCGERHIDGQSTRRALTHHKVSEEDYGWYVRLKDHRPMVTSGFGLGVERWMMWVLSESDIRQMAILPRYNGVKIVP